jgi:MORN repeat
LFLQCHPGGLGAKMRRLPVVIASALLLASGPLQAQQVAITQARPECPPGEPDSLQISWTKPCDSGTWLLDTELGCRMWDWHPEPQDNVMWRGACHGKLPDGPGEAQWYEHGRPIDRFTGVYRNGKREGPGHYVWNDNVRFDGTYANDVPQGYGVAEIEGERLSGEWNKGCLANGDKVVAIGVSRASCGPAGKRGNIANR